MPREITQTQLRIIYCATAKCRKGFLSGAHTHVRVCVACMIHDVWHATTIHETIVMAAVKYRRRSGGGSINDCLDAPSCGWEIHV